MSGWWKRISRINPATIWVESDYDDHPYDDDDDPNDEEVNDRIYFEIASNMLLLSESSHFEPYLYDITAYGCYSRRQNFPYMDQHIQLKQKNVHSLDATSVSYRVEHVEEEATSNAKTLVVILVTN